jgi:hypothetical protein
MQTAIEFAQEQSNVEADYREHYNYSIAAINSRFLFSVLPFL